MRDYVNLVELRGVCGGRATHVAGTLYGKQAAPRIVGIDDHIVDVPPSSHMLVVRNADVPGMIGKVGTILGDAGVNVDDMDVGKTAEGEAALMAHLDRRCRCPPRSSTPSAPRTASSTPAPSSSTDHGRSSSRTECSRSGGSAASIRACAAATKRSRSVEELGVVRVG